jgi:hypothetical protein
MTITALLASMLLAGDGFDVCRLSTIHLEVQDQQGLLVVPPPMEWDREHRRLWRRSTVFVGEPARGAIGISRARVRPPASGLAASLLVDGKLFRRFYFSTFGTSGIEGSVDGVDFNGDLQRFEIPDLAAGEHDLVVVLEGCDPARYTFPLRPLKVLVQPSHEPLQRANLHQYRARILAFEKHDCDAATREASRAAELAPEEARPLALKAHCAEQAGDLPGAIEFLRKARVLLEKQRRSLRESDSRMREVAASAADVDSKLERLDAVVREKRRSQP